VIGSIIKERTGKDLKKKRKERKGKGRKGKE
jgi:hypothetical protein